MDGPSVNWSVLDKLDDQCHQEILTINSCGLHIVHGALGSNIQKVDCGVGKLPRAIY